MTLGPGNQYFYYLRAMGVSAAGRMLSVRLNARDVCEEFEGVS